MYFEKLPERLSVVNAAYRMFPPTEGILHCACKRVFRLLSAGLLAQILLASSLPAISDHVYSSLGTVTRLQAWLPLHAEGLPTDDIAVVLRH